MDQAIYFTSIDTRFLVFLSFKVAFPNLKELSLSKQICIYQPLHTGRIQHEIIS